MNEDEDDIYDAVRHHRKNHPEMKHRKFDDDYKAIAIGITLSCIAIADTLWFKSGTSWIFIIASTIVLLLVGIVLHIKMKRAIIEFRKLHKEFMLRLEQYKEEIDKLKKL